MSAQPAAKYIPLVGPDGACLKCGIKNSILSHFCRSCGHEINLAANKLPSKKCLHTLIRQQNLYTYNYCPTCCEPISPISTDDMGILF